MQARQMTFSFQTHHPIKNGAGKAPLNPKRQIQLFQHEIQSLAKLTASPYQTLDKGRSKSNVDQQKTTITPSRHYTDASHVAPFETIEIGKQPPPLKLAEAIKPDDQRMQCIEQKLAALESKKETIMQQLKQHNPKTGQLQQQVEVLQQENCNLKAMLQEFHEKQKEFQTMYQNSNSRYTELQEANDELFVENQKLMQEVNELRSQSTKFEAELLSSQESISLVFEICQKAVSSQQMMKGFNQHPQLMALLGKIVGGKRCDQSMLQQSFFEQTQNYNVYCQPRKCDQVSTNKKSVSLQPRRNQSVNL